MKNIFFNFWYHEAARMLKLARKYKEQAAENKRLFRIAADEIKKQLEENAALKNKIKELETQRDFLIECRR